MSKQGAAAEAEESMWTLRARICLYGWAHIGQGLPIESLKRIVRQAVSSGTPEAEEFSLEYPDGMTAQDCHLTVHAAMKRMGVDAEADVRLVKYIRRCFSQDGNWWLFGFFPQPPLGHRAWISFRKRLEEEVVASLKDERPSESTGETAA
jgi:hypothetical protein